VLAGRLPVGSVVGKAEAEARLGRPVFDRRDHVLVATPDSTLSFTRVVPEDVARSLRTESGRALGFENDDEYRLTRQALRPMMRLAPESAAALSSLLDVVPDVDPVVLATRVQAAKIAVELRAVAVTTETLESQGWRSRMSAPPNPLISTAREATSSCIPP
jgi:hypothetical protein